MENGVSSSNPMDRLAKALSDRYTIEGELGQGVNSGPCSARSRTWRTSSIGCTTSRQTINAL